MSMQNKLGSVLTWFLCGLTASLVIAYGCGIRFYTVLSGSMEPAISTGSICIVDTHADYEEIQQGDVVAFRHGGSLIAHRVVLVTDQGLETKGDANDLSDGIAVNESNFHGRSVGAIPYVGYVFTVCRHPLILWPGMIVLAVYVFWREMASAQ